MKQKFTKSLSLAALAAAILPLTTHATPPSLIISEVDAAGSSASYGADWFELKNTGASAVDITGWKMDDNSASFSSAVALRGITSIAAGQTVVFLEGTTSGSTDASLDAAFESAWFGTSVPTGFTIANYGGSGVGLGTGGDAVNIYNASGTLQASVSFGVTTLGATLDNAAGLNNTTISTLSVAGVNNAALSSNGFETGSPGNIVAPVPEPSTLALAGLGLTGLLGLRRLKNRQA